MEAKPIRLLSPAKINLFLQVTGKRADTYHTLLTLMCPVNLYDTLSVSFGADRITLRCSNPDVPEDDTNLAHRAADLFLESVGKTGGVHIVIDKKIPVAAGLGGGSSNAASVLMAMNRYHGFPLSQQRLLDLGKSIGADVPFFIFQKPAVATGIGEQLRPYEGLNPFRALLIYPGFGVSTADVFKNLNLTLTKCKKIHKKFDFNKNGFDAVRHLCNDLEPVTASRYPDIDLAKHLLLRHGAVGALMSGSGPTVFGLYSDATAVKTARRSIQAAYHRWRLFDTELIL